MASGKKKADKARADKPRTVKGKVRGRMPTKRTINLVLIDENKINPVTAALAILLIIVLAGVFSKYMVIDRLTAMSRASAQVSNLQRDLDSAMDALDTIGDMSQTYAHYTLEDMTQAELSLVDRTLVLALVDSILPVVEEGPSEEEIATLLRSLYRQSPATGNDAVDQARAQERLALLDQLVPVPEYTVSRWNLADNLLTIEVNGQTLERLNLLGQQLERSAIVDSCTIITANKDDRRKDNEGVWARFIVYLQKLPDGMNPEDAAAPAAEEAKSWMPDFGAVTRFVGGDGEVSEE